MSLNRYAVLDTETTGVEPVSHRVIELVCNLYDDGKYVEGLRCVRNPGRPIPADATKINGWTDERVREAEPWSRADVEDLARLLASVSGPVYVHNLDFDLGFVRALAKHVGAHESVCKAIEDVPWVCTLQIARRLWPGEPNHLQAVAERLGVDAKGAYHEAGVDVAVLSDCVPGLLHRLAHRSRTALAVQAPAAAGSIELLASTKLKVDELAPRVQGALAYAESYACEDEETEKFGHEALARVKSIKAEADKTRLALVESMKRATADVDGLFREGIAKPCDQALGLLQGKLATYATARLQAQRAAEEQARQALEAERRAVEAEQAAAAAEALKVRQELDRRELEARRSGDAAAAAQAQVDRETAAARAAADEAARAARVHDAVASMVSTMAPAEPVKAGRATGGYKSRWTVRITNPTAVPDIYWRPDLDLLQKAVDEGARSIAGCEVVEELLVTNRRKG